MVDAKVKLAKSFNKVSTDVVKSTKSEDIIKRMNVYLKWQNEIKIIFSLKTFCLNNNFNMFDLSIDNIYAGQQIFKKEKNQWMKLRKQRLKKL